MSDAPAPSRSSARPSARDRRRHPRYACGVSVQTHLLASLDGDPWPVRVRNISAGGISLVSSRPFDADTVIHVDLFNRSRNFECRLEARVLYVVDHAGGDFILGCSFCRELADEEIEGLL